MEYCIYRIVNTVNDKVYVGLSTNPKKRISAHMTGTGSPLLKETVEEYGRGAFITQTIECYNEPIEANRRAQTYIMRNNALHPFGYNKSIGGRGSSGHVWDLKQRAGVTGSNNKRSKLNEHQVAAIYWDARPRSVIAKEYGISTTMVTKIKKGQAWRHVTQAFLAE